MDNFNGVSTPYRRKAYLADRPRLRNMPSMVDEEEETEGLWLPDAEVDLSVRSDKGYGSHRQNSKSDDLTSNKEIGEMVNFPVDSTLMDRETQQQERRFENRLVENSGSSSPLRISSDEDMDGAKDMLKDSEKTSEEMLSFEADTFPAYRTKYRDVPTSSPSMTIPSLKSEYCEPSTLIDAGFNRDVFGVVTYDDRKNKGDKLINNGGSLEFSSYIKNKSGMKNKSSSSPDLVGGFFSQSKLCATMSEKGAVHESKTSTPKNSITNHTAIEHSNVANLKHRLGDQSSVGNSAPDRDLMFFKNPKTSDLDKTPQLHQGNKASHQTDKKQQQQHHDSNDNYIQQQHQQGAADPNMRTAVEAPLQAPSDDAECIAQTRRGEHVSIPARTAEEASSGAAETTSQASSVSSCCSLTDTINKNVHNQKGLDFGFLKSAMKKSSQSEGQGHRRLSLFNSVMRRVSIHRRESTPTGRIATFLFGADDTDSFNKRYQDTKGTGEDSPHGPRARRAAHLRESLFLILSGLYGIVIVILGAVIPITEIFISEDIDSTFEGFYVYLYGVSILFLMYVYAYLLRRNRLKTEFLTRTLSRSLSWNKTWARNWARSDSETRGKFRKRMISLDVSNHHTGTFYLRLGVLGFGIGSMIHSGLNFGSFVSVSGEDCSEAVRSVKPLIHLVFTFFQLYFIFMNSKMCIHRYKKLARFGLVHMCATNICVWFRSIVVETLHVIHHSEQNGDHKGQVHVGNDHYVTGTDHDGGFDEHGVNFSRPLEPGHSPIDALYHVEGASLKPQLLVNLSDMAYLGRKLHAVVEPSVDGIGNASVSTRESCQWTNMMSQAVEAAGPYLYPCTIEYSLMCAGILYIMWTNVGKRPRRPKRSELETDSEDDDEQRAQRMSVDCTSSSRGLFLGILLMVGTIISIIAFYMLVNQEELKNSAIILTHLSGTFIYTVTLLALIMAAGRMKNLSFHNEQEAGLEDILIVISYTGLLVFIIFSLLASILVEHSTMSTMTVLSNVSMLIQATVQTIFMLAGDRMSAGTELQ
ncbi:otopetrin-2-like, partial [Plakobranchus ocellatus]